MKEHEEGFTDIGQEPQAISEQQDITEMQAGEETAAEEEALPADVNSPEEDPEDAQQDNGSQKRRAILWSVAGGYLAYLGYRICSDYFRGSEEVSLMILLAGIFFIVFGAVLLYKGITLIGAGARPAKKEELPASGEVRKAEETAHRSLHDRAKMVQQMSEEDGEEE